MSLVHVVAKTLYVPIVAKPVFLCLHWGSRSASDRPLGGQGAAQEAFPMLKGFCGVHARIRFFCQALK